MQVDIQISTIYLLRNLANNKIYIGQTWRTTKERWRNGTGYDECPYINKAIKKYGKEQFVYEILAYAYTQEQANDLEMIFIEKYNSCNPNIGYNIQVGGNNSRMSEETKIKISNALKGKPKSEEHIRKLTGANNPLYGKTMPLHVKEAIYKANKGRKASEETKQKLSEIHKGKSVSLETKQKISESSKGKVFSDDHIKNLSISHIGKVHTEEQKIKIGNATRSKTWKIIDGKRVWLDK